MTDGDSLKPRRISRQMLNKLANILQTNTMAYQLTVQSPVSGSWFCGNPEFVRSELVETLGFPFQVAGSAQPRVSCCGNIRRGPNLLGRWLDLL